MPYRDWHSVRIRNWRQAVPGTLRIKRIKGHPGLRLLVGKLRADGPMTMFGWRFRRDRYSLDEARGWIAKYKLRATHYSEATDEGPLGQGQKAGNTGVMVALMLPAATAQALTRQSAKFTRGLDQVPAEDMHITLALLGDIADGSFERNDAEALYVAVARVAKMWPAIAGVFNGAGYFIGGEGDEPLVALFDSPALPALREDLLARLRAIGVPAQQDHGFTPHTTLAYAPAGDKHGGPLLSEPVPATFESLVVAIGNERRSFPLTGTTTAGKAKMLAWAVEQLDEPALDDVLTALKHYGPGPHPSGSPQKSHAGDDEDGDAVYAEAFSPKRETAVAFGPQVALAQQVAAISEFLRRDGERYTADQIDYLFETKRGPTGEIRSVKPQVGAFWILPDGDIVTAKSRSGHYPHNDSALRALAAIGEKPAGEPYRALVKKGLAAWHSTSYEHRFFLPAKLTRAQRDTLETLFYRHGRMTRFDIEQEGRGMQSLDAEGAGQVIARAAKARAAGAKHYGPGNHWNGTPQSVHAGGGPQGERPPKARRVIGYYWQAPVFSVTRFEDFRSLRNSSIGVCLKGRNQGQIVCAASTVPHSLMADLLKDDVDNFVRFAWSKADQSLHVDTAYAAEWDRFSPAAVDNIYKALKRLNAAGVPGDVKVIITGGKQKEALVTTVKSLSAGAKHGGPGRHEGTGTPQQVHAGGRGTGDTAKDARPAGTEDAEDSAGRDAKIVADANATLKALPVSERLAEFAKLSPEEQDALADATRSIQSDITERLKFAGERPELTTYRQAVVRRLDQIGDYIPEDSSVRIREHISFLGDAIQAAGIDPELGHELVMDAVDALAVQENESLGRQLGDHGTRHILADMDMALEIMELHPGSDDARQAVAVSLAAIFHDTGYLTEPSKNFMDGDHPRWSAQHYEANLKGKVTRALGSEWANKIGRMIETHAEAEIDWDREPALSAIRVADNLALFHGEKLPGLFRYVPANIPVLYSLGKGKINIDEARRRMRANIGSKGLNLSKNVKAALNRAVDEVSDKTPKFTLGMLAGEVTGMEWSEDHLKVSMRRNSRAGILQRYLDLGQRQFQKFAKAYGADPVAFAERGKLELRRNGRMLLEATITGMGQKALVEAIVKATVVPGSLLEAVGQKGVEDAAGWQSLLDVVPEAHMAGLRFVPEAADGSAFYAAGQKAVLFDPAGGANEVARAIGEHVFTHLIGEKTRAAAQRALAAWPAGLLAEEPLSAADAFSAVYETALYTKATEDDATWREVTRAVPDLADVIGENVGLVAAERAGAEKRFAEEAADPQDSEEEIDMDIEEKDGADMTDLLESFARGFKHGGPGDHATTGSSQEVHGNWARASRGGSGPKRFSSDKIGRLQSEIDDLDDKYRAASGRNAQELKRQLDAKKAELRSARGQARAKPKPAADGKRKVIDGVEQTTRAESWARAARANADAAREAAKPAADGDDSLAALERTVAGFERQLKEPGGTAANRRAVQEALDEAKAALAAERRMKDKPKSRGKRTAYEPLPRNRSKPMSAKPPERAYPGSTLNDVMRGVSGYAHRAGKRMSPAGAIKKIVEDLGGYAQIKDDLASMGNRAVRYTAEGFPVDSEVMRELLQRERSTKSLPAAIPDAPPDLLAAYARGLKGREEKVTESVKEGHETDPFGDSLKHYGPGPHEGTGTTQRVHGGDETYTGNRPKRGAIRKIADLQDERYYLMSDSQDVDETLAAVGRRDAIGEYDGLLVDATMDYNEVWGFNGTPRLTKDAVLLFDGVYGDAASRARRRRSLGREKQLESGQKHGGPEPHATTGTPQSVHGNWSDAGVTVRLMEEETRKKRAAAAAKTDSKEPDDEAAWIEAFKREHGGVDPKTFYKGDMAAARQDRAWGAQFLKTHGRRPSQQDWEASFAERERGRKKPTTKTTTVKTTSAEKHYGPGKHPGTGTEQLVHGGGGKTSVGITSARPDKTDSETIYRDMAEFAGQLRAIKTVSNVSVEPGEGGWEGGSEYSWVVSYRGNGEARRLLAATGKKYDQDGILIYEPAKPHESASPLFDVDFGAKLDDEQREAVQNILLGERDSGGDAIIGGWTWYNRRGQTMLRMVHVPQWSAVGSDEFENRIRKVYSTLRGKWSTVRLDKDRVKVDIMEREGDNAYDRYLK